MKPRNIKIETKDKIRYELASYTAKEGSPTIVCFPAMGVEAKYYQPLAEELQENDLNVVTADLRGNGTCSIASKRKTKFGYKEMIYYDWPAVVDCVRDRLGARRVFLLGHSLGGQLSALYLSRQPYHVEGLILIAVSSVYYKAFPFPYNIRTLLGTQFVLAVAYLLGYFPGNLIGFGGDESKYVIRDWAHQGRTGCYELKGSTENFELLLAELDKPVLAISIDSDTLAPFKAVDHFCQKLRRSNITRWHYVPEESLSKKIDHFRWVRHPKAISTRISEWIS